MSRLIPTPSTHKSQNMQTVVNKPKQSISLSSTSSNSSSSDSVKSLILKLNAAKQRQKNTMRKTVPPNDVPQNRIPTVSENRVSVQSTGTSILEQMFMSNKRPVLSQHVKSKKSSTEAPRVTSKSSITASSRGASSSIKQILLSSSGKPALAVTQPPRPDKCRPRSVEPRVTPQIAMTGSSKVVSTLEEYFLSNSGGRLQPVIPRRRSAEEARCTPQVPVMSSNVAGTSVGRAHHHIQSADNLRKSLQNVAPEVRSSKAYCKGTPPSSVLTIRRLGAVNDEAGAPNDQLIEQGRSSPQKVLQAKKHKSRKFGGKENGHSEHSHPVDTERHSDVREPPHKSKRISSVGASETNAESTKRFKGDDLQSQKHVRQTHEQKREAGSKKTSKSSVLSKKNINNHSRSTQKTKQSRRKRGLEDIEARSRKTPDKLSWCDVDSTVKSGTKKTTIHPTSKKNSKSHSHRELYKCTKKSASETSVGSKRAASSKDSHSQSRKRVCKSATKSYNDSSDESDSGLQKPHTSEGSIFTLSELEHACNTLVPFSEIKQLEERLHRGPITATRHATGSHSGLGSIFDARIHPGGIWKSIIDES